MRWKVMVEWKVQSIQPYHRIRALMSMIMPLPLRCQDDVSCFHVDSFSFDGGESPASFNNEAEGERPMTVGRGCLSGFDQL